MRPRSLVDEAGSHGSIGFADNAGQLLGCLIEPIRDDKTNTLSYWNAVESFVDADLREHRQWTLPAIDVPCSNQNKPDGHT